MLAWLAGVSAGRESAISLVPVVAGSGRGNAVVRARKARAKGRRLVRCIVFGASEGRLGGVGWGFDGLGRIEREGMVYKDVIVKRASSVHGSVRSRD